MVNCYDLFIKFRIICSDFIKTFTGKADAKDWTFKTKAKARTMKTFKRRPTPKPDFFFKAKANNFLSMSRPRPRLRPTFLTDKNAIYQNTNSVQ